MKRKTNLFYFNGDDSNFLAFSNYGEHLTGNFLATDYKLFPTRFLCLNIPALNDNAKKELFIKEYLCGYYENKLAFLRDKFIENGLTADNKLLYLNYLLDAIYYFNNECVEEDDNKFDFNNIFIGNITEQNYNGTFTDIICNIEYFSNKTYSIGTHVLSNYESYEYEYSTDYLYNWNIDTNYIGPDNYSTIKPKFDTITNSTNNIYILDSIFDTKLIKNEVSLNELKFNIIIPLYDCVNTNYDNNSTILMESNEIDLITSNDDTVRNVPYGIWFANETITLKKDVVTGYTPSWSLLIGTQFKSFPNSNKLSSDEYNPQLGKAYLTFAEILSKQNSLIESFSKYNVIIASLSEKIKTIENSLSTICDLTEITYLKNEMKQLIDKFNVNDDNITSSWQYVNTNNNNM